MSFITILSLFGTDAFQRKPRFKVFLELRKNETLKGFQKQLLSLRRKVKTWESLFTLNF